MEEVHEETRKKNEENNNNNNNIQVTQDHKILKNLGSYIKSYKSHLSQISTNVLHQCKTNIMKLELLSVINIVR